MCINVKKRRLEIEEMKIEIPNATNLDLGNVDTNVSQKGGNKFGRIMKKICIVILIAIFILAISVGFLNLYVIHKVNDLIYDSDEVSNLNISGISEELVSFDAQCIIVLGCGILPDGGLSRMLKDRMDTAIALYEEGVAPKLLLSGDHGTIGYDEVNAMRQYAINHGIPEEDIFMDHAGFSTYETMYRAEDVFDVDKAIVVTQQYHLYRAVYNAEVLGIDARGVSAISEPFAYQPYYSFREAFARVKDWAYCIIKPKPTYLGENIDIEGDGRLTWD